MILLVQYSASITDAEPTLNQHWVNVLYRLGNVQETQGVADSVPASNQHRVNTLLGQSLFNHLSKNVDCNHIDSSPNKFTSPYCR